MQLRITNLITVSAATFSILILPICLLAEDANRISVQLRSGGTVNGTKISEPVENGRKFLVLRTDSGSVLKLAKGLIQRVVEPDTDLVGYQLALGKMQETADGHWAMYDWCKKNGGLSRYRQQMNRHLRQIVKLDPTDSKAWQKLNYVKVDDQWVPEEQHHQSRGYRKYKGKWIPAIQKPNSADSDSANPLGDRKTALKNWQNNYLNKRDFESVRAELFRIVDGISVGYFENRFIKKETDPARREFYLEAVGQVDSRLAQSILVGYAMLDSDSAVREKALDLLELEEHFDKARTTGMLTSYLGNSSNQIVNRAGRLIGRIKHESAIIPLIGALETVHKEATGTDPGRLNTGFDSNGGASFGTGGPKFVTRSRQNKSVLRALNNITGQNFRFEPGLWKEWYVDQHTVTDYSLGR